MTHYVYRCYQDDGRAIYIGSSANPFKRLEHHRRTQPWIALVAHVRITVHPDKKTALAIERSLIASEDPRFNSQGRWANRARWNAQDYLDFAGVLLAGKGWYTRRATFDQILREYAFRFGCDHPMGPAIADRFAQHRRDLDELAVRRERKAIEPSTQRAS